MTAIAYALAYVGGIACGTLLVLADHRWFAVLVFVLTASLHFKETT
jgi:hypothetical protein